MLNLTSNEVRNDAFDEPSFTSGGKNQKVRNDAFD